jgi:hypothetical protein
MLTAETGPAQVSHLESPWENNGFAAATKCESCADRPVRMSLCLSFFATDHTDCVCRAQVQSLSIRFCSYAEA